MQPSYTVKSQAQLAVEKEQFYAETLFGIKDLEQDMERMSKMMEEMMKSMN